MFGILGVALGLVSAVLAGGVGEVRTCSGCRLNRLHEVRKFVYEEAGKYENLNVKFIGGHNPDLIIYADAQSKQEVERIDLAPYSLADLHNLVKTKGFLLKSTQGEL